MALLHPNGRRCIRHGCYLPRSTALFLRIPNLRLSLHNVSFVRGADHPTLLCIVLKAAARALCFPIFCNVGLMPPHLFAYTCTVRSLAQHAFWIAFDLQQGWMELPRFLLGSRGTVLVIAGSSALWPWHIGASVLPLVRGFDFSVSWRSMLSNTWNIGSSKLLMIPIVFVRLCFAWSCTSPVVCMSFCAVLLPRALRAAKQGLC